MTSKLTPGQFWIIFLAFCATAACLKERLSDLRIQIDRRVPGCERRSAKGDQIAIHFTGKLYSTGKQFHTSIGQQPAEFTLGKGQVLQGWEEGLLDMCEGEKRTLLVPARMGLSQEQAGEAVPEDSDLEFQVQLLHISDAEQEDVGVVAQRIFSVVDSDADGSLDEAEVRRYVLTQANSASAQIQSDIEKVDPRETAKKIFASADTNGDGTISFVEFKATLESESGGAKAGSDVNETNSQKEEEDVNSSWKDRQEM